MGPPRASGRARGPGVAVCWLARLGPALAAASCVQRDGAFAGRRAPECSSSDKLGDDFAFLQTQIRDRPSTRTAELSEEQSETLSEALNAELSAELSAEKWHPKIHQYIQFLEALEAARTPSQFEEPSLEDIESEDRNSSVGVNGSTLFLVITDSNDYDNRLKWIGETWAKELPPDSIVAIGDAKDEDGASPSLRVQPTRCPAHTHDGACCKEAEAVITAYELLRKNSRFRWAYVVDDDAYVRPVMLEKQLQWIDHKGEGGKGMLVGLQGCGTPKCPRGLCGGGGHAFSQEALETFIDGSPSAYLKQHMVTCDKCAMYGDVTVGTQADQRGVSVSILDGLNGWLMAKQTFDEVLTRPYEPIMYHYIKTRGQMNFLHGLFNNRSSAAPVDGAACAKYKGHAQCSSEPSALPWS